MDVDDRPPHLRDTSANRIAKESSTEESDGSSDDEASAERAAQWARSGAPSGAAPPAARRKRPSVAPIADAIGSSRDRELAAAAEESVHLVGEEDAATSIATARTATAAAEAGRGLGAAQLRCEWWTRACCGRIWQ